MTSYMLLLQALRRASWAQRQLSSLVSSPQTYGALPFLRLLSARERARLRPVDTEQFQPQLCCSFSNISSR